MLKGVNYTAGTSFLGRTLHVSVKLTSLWTAVYQDFSVYARSVLIYHNTFSFNLSEKVWFRRQFEVFK